MKILLKMTVGLLASALALIAPGIALGGNEQKIDLADCPAAVQKTIKDNANGGTIVEVEKETKKDGTFVYEAEVKRADGREMDIEVAEDGRLIKIEVEEAEDDADDSN